MRKILASALALLAASPVAALLALEEARPAGTATELSAAGVSATIVRDAWGVPHIYASDAYSLFYANGYAQAQDRLAQMEILRHVGRGELAKLTGPSGLALDLVTRRELYTHEERVAAFHALPAMWQDAFEAYAAGVNRWIDEAKADPAKLPVEYPALVVAPEPWVVTDTLAIAQYLLDVFGRGSGGQEMENAQLLAQLAATLGSEEAAHAALGDLVWVQRDPGRTYTTIKATDGARFAALPAERAHAYGDWPAAQAEAIAAAEAAKDVDDAERTLGDASAAAGLPFRFGSNAQLIDARFTRSGEPILYGGPQMGYFTPMIPYELGLHGAGFDAVGMGVAGAPGVIIGRAGAISWTVTSGASDQVDMVAEKLVGDAYHYEVDGEVLEMDCRIETHLVRPGPADFAPGTSTSWRPPMFDIVEQEVCRTIHGPVLARSATHAFASHRSYRGDEARSGTIWLQIGTIRSIEDFRALFADFAFTFNFNFAEGATREDPDGRIAYFHVGRQPLRDERLDPRYPRPGWDSSYEWKGFAHLEQLPHVVDPASGYTVNWNNNPAIGWSGGDARELWGEIHRAELMEEELLPLLRRGNVTLDDVRAVNQRASTREPYADDLARLMRGAAVAAGDARAVDAIDAWARARFTYEDDGAGNYRHAAFRLFELWREKLQVLVFADELGAATKRFHWDPATGGDPHAADHGDHTNKHNVLLDALEGRAVHAWCDDVTTAAVETCAEQALAAMRAALAEDWASPFPVRESKFTALGAGPSYRIPMTNRPSFQHFYDWGAPEGPARSRNVLPPGASGHMNSLDYGMVQFNRNGCEPCPLPPHLEDQLAMYVEFRDKPLLYDDASVARFAASRMVLTT